MGRRLLPVLFLVAAGFMAGLAVAARTRIAADSRAEPAPATAPQTTAAPVQPRAPAAAAPYAAVGPDFTRVAGQTVRGVANISALQIVRTRNSPFANDPFFRYFFSDDDVFGSRDRRSLSLGSGVIISNDGYVV